MASNFVSIFLFAIGISGSLIPNFVISSFLQYVCSEVWNISATNVSIMWIAYNLTKLTGMLLFGSWLDKTSISHIKIKIFSSFCIVFGFYTCWVNLFTDSSELIQFLSITGSLIIYGLGETMYTITRSSVFQSRFSAEERAKVMVPQQLFFIVGIMVGLILPPILSQQWTNIPFMAQVIAGICLVASSSGIFGSMLQNPVNNQKSSSSKDNSNNDSLFSQLSDTFKNNKVFIQYLIGIYLTNVGFCCMMSALQLYVKYMVTGVNVPLTVPYFDVELDGPAQIGVAQLTGQITSIFCTPIWMKISSILGKGKTWQISCLAIAAVQIIQYFFETGEFYFALCFQVSILRI